MVRSKRGVTNGSNEVPLQKKKLSQQESMDQIDDDDSNNSNDVRTTRTTTAEEEFFVKLCVKYFDEIHCKSTIRELPTTDSVDKHKEKIEEAYEKLTHEMNEFSKVILVFQNMVMISFLFYDFFKFQVDRTVGQIKKKFENIKGKARKRKGYIMKIKKTGGGSLSNAERQVVEWQSYSDLILKMGESGSGNEPRNDSDAAITPTKTSTDLSKTLKYGLNVIIYLLNH